MEKMIKSQKFNTLRVIITIIAIVVMTGLFYLFGRSLWHPILVKVAGGSTIEDRLTKIRQKKPYLDNIHTNNLAILCFKKEKRIEVYCDDKFYKSFPILAASGKLGPKLQQGDRQVPEGFYSFTTLNPDSSFYLSLKISYPNSDDISRSSAAGIKEYGGDIYMHGDSVSIGCIAIGDDAIEDVFYLVFKTGLDKTKVIISPVDFRVVKDYNDSKNSELYSRLSGELIKVYR